jgi:hypothetical protein
MRTNQTLAILSPLVLAALLVAPGEPVAAAASVYGNRVSIYAKPGKRPGTIELRSSIPILVTKRPKHGSSGATSEGYNVNRVLSFTVPEGAARKFFEVARGGDLRVTTASAGPLGRSIRLVARRGEETVILDRIRMGGSNGESGSANVMRMQLGLGPKATAFYLGRTGVTTLDPKTFAALGTSSVFRSGKATVIDPATLLPTNTISFARTVGPNKRGGDLSWLMKATRKLTEDPRLPLSRYGSLPNPVQDWEIHNVAGRIVWSGVSSSSD